MITHLSLLFSLIAFQSEAPVPTVMPQAQAIETAPKPKDPARLSIEPKGRIDLGSVGPREKKEIRYTFKNTSDTPISMRVTDTSPGVTVEGPALQKPFQPGESLELVLRVDSTDMVGWQTRRVKILTDDPNQGEYRLPVALTVRPDLTVDEAKKSFGAVAPHESPHLLFTFTRETGEPTVLKLEKELPEYLQAEFSTKGNKVELALILRPQKIQPGVMQGLEPLVISTNAPQQPRFELYLDWKLRPPVMPEPSRIVFLEAKDLEKSLHLKASEGKLFHLLEAKLEGEGFKVENLPVAATSECTLKIQRTALKGARALLVLHFKGQAEALNVPLAYLPPPEPSKSTGESKNP